MAGFKVFAPATISNLSVGFDLIGIALESIGDEIIIKKGDKPGLQISTIKGGKSKIPYELSQNTAGAAAISLLRELDALDESIDLEIRKGLGIGTGLGSSAASSVASAFAINEYLGRPLTKSQLLKHALVGERVVSPNCPADNIAASMLGGFVLSDFRNSDKIEHLKLYIPSGLCFVVIYPQVQISTEQSRKSLPSRVEFSKYIHQSTNLAFFTTALQRGDFLTMKKFLNDSIVEDHRKHNIPLFEEIRSLCDHPDCFGHGISGSGPSMFAFCHNTLIAEKIKDEAINLFEENQIEAKIFISGINQQGAVVC